MSAPEFEWDEAKSRANKFKHGIDFTEARALWLDSFSTTAVPRTLGESRFIVIGMIAGKHWTAVITHRGAAVRIISVRRSRVREVQTYESQ